MNWSREEEKNTRPSDNSYIVFELNDQRTKTKNVTIKIEVKLNDEAVIVVQ